MPRTDNEQCCRRINILKMRIFSLLEYKALSITGTINDPYCSTCDSFWKSAGHLTHMIQPRSHLYEPIVVSRFAHFHVVLLPSNECVYTEMGFKKEPLVHSHSNNSNVERVRLIKPCTFFRYFEFIF